MIASARSRLTWNGLGPNNRSICRPFSCLSFDSPRADGCCQSPMACTANSWRTENPRYRHLRKHCVFTVQTITMNVLFVFIVLEHRRCQELHFKVTEHLTAACRSQ